MKDDGNTLVISLISGKEISGQSDSSIEGIWELGKYKIKLTKVKSMVMDDTVKALEWKKPKGYVAAITDTQGSIMEVYGLSFGYSYYYWRSNCIGACGATSRTTLETLPINHECGTTFMPL